MFKQKKKEYFYNFNYDKEKKIYDNIGNRGKCRSFSTYLEWRAYVEEIIPNDFINLTNFKRYLNRKARNAERSLEVYKTIAVPMYMAIVTVYATFAATQSQDMLNMLLYWNVGILLILGLTIAVQIMCFGASQRKIFYNDYIEIIQGKLDYISNSKVER